MIGAASYGKTHISVFLFALWSCTCDDRPLLGASASNQFDMGVTFITRAPDLCALDIELTYTGQNPLEIWKYRLPWENRYSMVVLAVAVDHIASVIPEIYQTDDPGLARHVLTTGTTLRGRIDLKERFPTLPDVLKQHDILIFWSYKLVGLKGDSSDRKGGWLLIPREIAKARWPHEPCLHP